MKHCLLTFWIFAFFASTTPSVRAGELNIEMGGTVGLSEGSGGLTETVAPLMGFSATFGWFSPNWMFGVTTRGGFSPRKSETAIITPEQSLIGATAVRRIHYGLTGRHYFLSNRYYQIEASIASLEAIHANRHLVPKLPTGNDRFFFRGYSLKGGYGFEFKNQTQFLRLDYEYERYRSVNIVQTVYDIGNEASTAYLHSSAHIHAILLTYGFTKIF